MLKYWCTFLFCCSIVGWSGLHGQDHLKQEEISSVMQLLLKDHVDKKNVSGQLLQQALIIYIDQFDPRRLYLLESEVAPFLRLSAEKQKEIVQQYERQDFSLFAQLNAVIQAAIQRARHERAWIEAEERQPRVDPPFNQAALAAVDQQKDTFPQNINQLKERWMWNLATFSASYKQRYGPAFTKRQKEAMLTAYEKQLREFENHYLYQNEQGEPLSAPEQEHLFVLHMLKALSKSLDAHSSFYQASEAYDMRIRLQKEFQGIGLVLKETSSGIVVSHIFADSPAARTKLIEVGDRLLKVDGQPVEGHSFEEVMGWLHGQKEAPISLVLRREDPRSDLGLREYAVELKRERIILNSNRVDVSTEKFGNGIIGTITLHAFYEGNGISSEKDVREAIEQLKKEGPLRGLILDLRENSGGFVSQAVKVAGLFITNGVIVISKYGSGKERIYRDVDGTTAYDGPLIVLTSKATASAAEIVAQALQDYGVALIVGDEHTYGKGTIQSQTVTNNRSASYFKVTVGKYYTVSGHTPQKQGVKADIVAPGHWSREQIGEMYVADALEPDMIAPAYQDDLKDLSVIDRLWFLKYYVPTLQLRTTIWQQFVPILSQNSAYRIAHNKNYQTFLKGGGVEEEIDDEEEWYFLNKPRHAYGENDLQLQEAVNILKDMIYLDGLRDQEAKKEPKEKKVA